MEGAENDAREIYELLKDVEIGNFDIPDDHFLTGKKATCENIRKAISDVFWKTEPCDLALFYFSGHGFVDGYGDGYIAPYDISKVEPFVCGINMEHIKQTIFKSISGSAVMILDCCHSGIAAERDKSIADATKKFENLLKDKESVLSSKGRVILASSEGSQTSKEISQQKHRYRDEIHPHGTFSYYLIEGIDGEASKDVESGIITLDKLFKYAADETEKQKKQRPLSSAVDAGPLERIEIAIAAERYKKYIQSLIKGAESELNKGEYSFIWDKIAEMDSDKFKEFLKQNFGVDWVIAAKIDKINETLNVSTQNNSLSLSLNNEKSMANLTFSDGRVDTLIVKMENSGLKIYTDISNLIFAVRKISEVLRRDVKNHEANELKNKINDALINQKIPVDNWLRSNLLDVRHDLRDLIPEIRRIIGFLCFDGIRTINKRQELLLINLYDVSKNKMTKNEFIEECKQIDKRYLSSGVSS